MNRCDFRNIIDSREKHIKCLFFFSKKYHRMHRNDCFEYHNLIHFKKTNSMLPISALFKSPNAKKVFLMKNYGRLLEVES